MSSVLYSYTFDDDISYQWANSTYEISLNTIKLQFVFTISNECYLNQVIDGSNIKLTNTFSLKKTNKFAQAKSDWPIGDHSRSGEAKLPQDIANLTGIYYTNSTALGTEGTIADKTGFLFFGFEFINNFSEMRFLDDNDEFPTYPIIFPYEDQSTFIQSPYYYDINEWSPVWFNDISYNERIFTKLEPEPEFNLSGSDIDGYLTDASGKIFNFMDMYNTEKNIFDISHIVPLKI